MKSMHHGLLMAAIALLPVGCSEETPFGGNQHGTGSIRLRLAADASVTESAPTVRTAGSVLNPPIAADFSIQLDKTDDSFSKEWTTLADFNSEKGFKSGTYTITATYGDIEEEGFEKPCFMGSSQVTVLDGTETETSITATLANSMISVGYTDAFINYFTDYGVTVHSAGHSYLKFEKTETRPVFLAPGNVDVSVSFTMPNGKEATLQPAEFMAEKRHHYKLTFDVNHGAVGYAQLTIRFDDTVDTQDVSIDLTDELFTSPAPTVTAEGFTPGTPIEILERTGTDSPLRFNVIARGGIQQAVMTLNSDSYTSPLRGDIDLCAATEAQKNAIGEAGIQTMGFFRNPDKMGTLDVSGLLAHLPGGTHTVTLRVKDRFTRVSEPVTLSITSVPVDIAVTPGNAIYGAAEGSVTVAYNGSDPEKVFSFEASTRFGRFTPCKIKSVEKLARSRAFETESYKFTLELPTIGDRSMVPLKVYYAGTLHDELDLPVKFPNYDADLDVYSEKVVLRIRPENPALTSMITGDLKIYLTEGKAVSESQLRRDQENGTITLFGLNPGTKYTVRFTLDGAANPQWHAEIPIETEPGTQLDFSQTSQLQIDNLQVGGKFRNTALSTKANISSIDLSVPAGKWATLNPLTAYSGSTNKNTWFIVPSTFIDNDVITVRSVGYNHAGTTPETTGSNANSTYYCTSAPTQDGLAKSKGELFLGSYSFAGTLPGSRTDGIAFAARPEALSFGYEYISVNNEKGEAYVRVMDSSGNILAKGDVEITAGNGTVTIPLNTYPWGVKAQRIQLGFRSTKGESVSINIPTDLNEPEATYGNRTISANQYKAVAIGSQLKLMDVRLEYDPSKAKARKAAGLKKTNTRKNLHRR